MLTLIFTKLYILIDHLEQVLDGLEKAVKNMKKGEIALLIIQPDYAFGSSGSPQEYAIVPPNSTVYYEVELLSFVKVRELCLHHFKGSFRFEYV